MLYSLLYTALAIQWNLQIKDSLGPTVLSAIERSSSRRSMENNYYYKLCLVERLSIVMCNVAVKMHDVLYSGGAIPDHFLRILYLALLLNRTTF